MPAKVLSMGQLAESTARKRERGEAPGGAGCPQAARSGNRTFPTFSARLLELMSQDCQGLSAPQGQLREAQPENTREGLSPLAPVPASKDIQEEGEQCSRSRAPT